MVEIAIFGSILIFLIGVILRTHLSNTQSENHQVMAMKIALQQSNINSLGIGMMANSSRNSASVLFIEDRLYPDFNKFSTIDRSPFIASGSGTMSNRLEYPIDFETYAYQPVGEIGYNLPVMDLYVNGQHFPLTTAAYIFRLLYDDLSECPDDTLGSSLQKGPEYSRCYRQVHEKVGGVGGNTHKFYGMEVNGTTQWDGTATNATFDLQRNDWDISPTGEWSGIPKTSFSFCTDDVTGCQGTATSCGSLSDIRVCTKYWAWQWRSIAATGGSFLASVPTTPKDVTLGFKSSDGSSDSPNYPSADTSGSLREQSIYAISQVAHDTLKGRLSTSRIKPYEINGNPFLLSLTMPLFDVAGGGCPGFTITTSADGTRRCGLAGDLGITRKPVAGIVTGVVILDNQLGDLDQTYDKKLSPGPPPGLMSEMQIYSQVNSGTYLEIKEGKLFNPETHAVVRSISNRDHIDLISRAVQLSNDTGRFCRLTSGGTYQPPANLIDQHGEENPVKACSDCFSNAHSSRTCFDVSSRILYIRTVLGDRTTRKWFADVSKGL